VSVGVLVGFSLQLQLICSLHEDKMFFGAMGGSRPAGFWALAIITLGVTELSMVGVSGSSLTRPIL
jgi:hypothetical protein